VTQSQQIRTYDWNKPVHRSKLYICHALQLAGRAWFRRMIWTDLSHNSQHASRRNRYRNDKSKDIDTLSISLWSWITHAAPR